MKRISILHKAARFCAAAAALLLAVSLLSGCALTNLLFGGGDSTTASAPVSTEDPVTSSPEMTTSPAVQTTVPGGEITTSEPVQTFPSADTTSSDQPPVLYTDPLTGLSLPKDYSRIRPVSIVMDNISLAYPQSGLSSADIVIEVPVEGGITRLILITNKYEDKNYVYGPVRSTRDYMVGLTQAFGTLMVGAGGSPTGYEAISSNRLQYIDGVNDSVARSFFRSDERKTQSGYEHSLMITANGIRANASAHNFTTVRQTAGTVFPFRPDSSRAPASAAAGAAVRTILTYSNYQQVQLLYSAKNNAYYRYEFGTKPHYDAEDGEHLRFENVLILFSVQNPIPDDDAGRINVQTTGSNTGYYLTGGEYRYITWKRSSFTSAFQFSDADGKTLQLTPGKTMITMVDGNLRGTDKIVLNLTAEADT